LFAEEICAEYIFAEEICAEYIFADDGFKRDFAEVSFQFKALVSFPVLR